LVDEPRIQPEPDPSRLRQRRLRGRGRLRRRQPDAAAAALDTASGGRIKALLERGDIVGKTGKTALLHDLPNVAAPRVLVIGLGDAGKFGVPQYLKAVGDAARALKTGAGDLRPVHPRPKSRCRPRRAWNLRRR
jgi:leucyl aminopeptidase